MNELIFDIKYNIAKISPHVWVIFAIYDAEFREYSRSQFGIIRFRQLFTISTKHNYGIEYTLLGLPHNEGDMPAIITNSGDKYWYKSGLLHRDDDLPAVMYVDRLEWWVNGTRCRPNDLPAVVSGHHKIWYDKGVIHRSGDKPAIITETTLEWFEYGERKKLSKWPKSMVESYKALFDMEK